MSNSNLTEVKEGQVYAGYDYLTAAEVCTPSILGCSACIGVNIEGGNVILMVTVKSPFGNFTKSFTIKGNISFTFQPIPKVKVTISITNFSNKDGKICFDLGASVCIDVPIVGWKCINFSHQFCLPHLLAPADLDKMKDAEFGSHLALLLLSESGNQCGCKKG